jgi:predicted NUDIX family phosphoesterase
MPLSIVNGDGLCYPLKVSFFSHLIRDTYQKEALFMQEDVLIIQNDLLPHIETDECCLITEDKDRIFDTILKNQLFMLRDEAEYNFEHKQVIPYVIVQSEKRLHNKYSLGIGGHINPVDDMEEENIIITSLYRELNEEVLVNDQDGLSFIGIINDESNSVSKVHLGLLYVLEASTRKFKVLETDKMTAQWVPENDLKDYYDGLETWSQVVYDHYIANNGASG